MANSYSSTEPSTRGYSPGVSDPTSHSSSHGHSARHSGAPPLLRAGDDAAVHVLRLCLNLQLDAMLLTLGAAAADRGSGVGTEGSNGAAPAGGPWLDWLASDIDLTCTLAGDVLAGGAPLPAVLGHQLHHDVPATRVEQLSARYEALVELLETLVGQPGADRDPARERHAKAAIEHCRARLDELSRLSLEATPPRGIPSAERDRYLPGELLG